MTKPSQPGLVRRVARALGPGLITGAADDDPSGIVTYSMAGAQHGMALLWLAWITWPLMAAVQMMCARIGMVTGKGLGEVLTLKFPRAVVVVACCALFLANTINIAADLAGMGDAASMLFGRQPSPLRRAVRRGHRLCHGALPIRPDRGRAQMAGAVAVCLRGHCIPGASELARGGARDLRPDAAAKARRCGRRWWRSSAPPSALISSSGRPHRRSRSKRCKDATGCGAARPSQAKLVDRMLDVGAGTFLSNLIMFFIILTAALTLHAQGKTEITTSREAAEALRPLAGNFAVWLYAVAIVAVGLLSIPTLAGSAGYAFGEALHWPKGLDKKLQDAVCFYVTIVLSVAIAVGIDFLKIDPIQSLFWSAIINGVLAPFLLAAILLSARDPLIMKKQPSSVPAQAIVALTTAAMFAAAGVMLYGTLQGN